jgi:N-acetylneuraminate synthase/N,N'-diacetyllegionaminate synthase
MKNIRLGDRWIGIGEPCFIIAEAGSNHDRKFSQAIELIDVALEARADAVKFQILSADTLYSENAPAFGIIKENEFPREWLRQLYEYAKKKGIIFLATPFDKSAVDQLYEIGVPCYKWSSLEIVNLPLLRYAASKGKPIILSTGVSDLSDIQQALNEIYSAGNKNVILLHCASLFEYPQKPEQVNLRMLDTMRNAFDVPVGFSDHTLSIAIPASAVGRGACIIEKHITLDRNLKGPDHSFALMPQELKEMVKAIREVEASLGSPIKKAIFDEEKAIPQRPSIIARVDIPQGTIITEDMVITKRPGYGIAPKYLSVIVGRTTKKHIKKGEGITWDLI